MSAILTNQVIEIIRGDDYDADTQQIVFSGYGISWPTVAPASVELNFYEIDGSCNLPDSVAQSSGVIDWVSIPKKLTFDLSRAATATLQLGVRRYMFDVRGITASGSVLTLVRGTVTVLQGSV